MRLMRSIINGSLTALWVAIVLLVLSLLSLAGAFIWLRIANPSDGARLEPRGHMWSADGITIMPLSEPPNGLRRGDVVKEVEGRDMGSWVRALFDPLAERPKLQFGQPLRYTVLRDGRLEILVFPERYSFIAALNAYWGAFLFLLTNLLVAAFVFLRRPRDLAPRLVFIVGVCLAASYAVQLLGLEVGDIVGRFGFWAYSLAWSGLSLLAMCALLHLALIFPMPLPSVITHPRIIPTLYAVAFIAFSIYLVIRWYMTANALQWLRAWEAGQNSLFSLYLALALAVTAVSYRRHRMNPLIRQQLALIVASLGLLGTSDILFVHLPEILIGRPLLDVNLISLIGVLIPISLAIAILRHHLFDIDSIINRTLVYGALTVIVASLYILLVGVVGTWLHARMAGPHTLLDLMVSLLATAMVAILFQPLRERLQRAVNHLMYGYRDDPYTVLTQLGRRLEADLTADSVLQTIVETIAFALKLPYAAITLRDEDSPAAAFGSPSHVANLRAFPLHYQGEMIGELRLAPRATNEEFTPSEESLLTDLARQAEAAVYNVRLTLDLRASRERLVTAREEERRRIRRDLHDGVGPLLASQTLMLEALEKLIARDPLRAVALVKTMKDQSEGAVREIRQIIYDLRPPILDDMGLIEALREGAARLGNANTAVHLEIESGLPNLSAALELAIYRIVMEALTNVMRHARAQNCYLRLWMDHDLKLEIMDDGIGLPDGFRAGVGLSSIRERAEELSGVCLIENIPGQGARILVHLPPTKEMT